MKVSHAVAKFLQAQGLKHVFGVNGGANLHLIHALDEVTDIKFIPGTHECNSGFSADAYARITGLACAMGTSGPGATNLITSIATSYYDSVPVLYITGNVATFRFGAPLGVRCYGFQETPIVEMVENITKFSWQADVGSAIPDMLAYAIQQINEGRKGPALIDIPDDVQRQDI